mgnify:CR=1 FL=1
MVRVLLLFFQAQESEHVARAERTDRERIPLLHRRLLSWQGSAGGVGVIGCEAGDIEADDKKRDSAGFD